MANFLYTMDPEIDQTDAYYEILHNTNNIDEMKWAKYKGIKYCSTYTSSYSGDTNVFTID